MFGFSKTVSGLEVGTKALRAVRVRSGENMSIEGYSEQPLPEGVLLLSYIKENIADKKRFNEALALSLGAAGISRGDIALAIPDQVAKVSFIELKEVSRKRDDVLNFIKWKSKRFLPYEPDTAQISCQIFGNAAMAVFVKKEVVSNYEEAVTELSLRPQNVMTPSLSLFNLFSGRFGNSGDFAFISILEDSFAVFIVQKNLIVFHRASEVGFTDDRLTQEINSSILFYTTENPGFAVNKAFLYIATGDSDQFVSHLSDSLGIGVEAVRLSHMIKGPRGVDIEPYGPAVAAAMYGS